MNASFSSVLCLSLLAASALALPSSLSRPWSEDIIYFALLDRFHDGDPANNRPSGGDPNLYDPTQSEVDLYHGGDFRGLELALEAGYFNRLGISAIWITPPVRNVWYSAFDSNDADALVDDFVEIYAFYIETIGVDGLRIDTVKHVDHAFWDAFTERLRARLGPERSERLILFGEVYDGDPISLGLDAERSDADRAVELSWHESLPSAVIEAAPESIQLFRIARRDGSSSALAGRNSVAQAR